MKNLSFLKDSNVFPALFLGTFGFGSFCSRKAYFPQVKFVAIIAQLLYFRDNVVSFHAKFRRTEVFV